MLKETIKDFIDLSFEAKERGDDLCIQWSPYVGWVDVRLYKGGIRFELDPKSETGANLLNEPIYKNTLKTGMSEKELEDEFQKIKGLIYD